jgi:osmotically-inducible protein OsmY
MEPLERRYFGRDDRPPAGGRRRRGEPELGWQIGPGMGGAGDTTLAPGPHVGRGPRDWRRSDARIREDVCQWMSDDPRLDAREIDVRVHDGDVTLEGRVEDRAARRLAEDIAAAVPGVRDVFNRLTSRERRPA